MNNFKLSTIAALAATFGVINYANADQKTVDQLSQLKVNYQIVDNLAADHGVDCSALGADWASCNKVTITLTNPSNEIEGKDWAIYFHSVRQILRVDNDQFKITHVTGDLHKLEPTDKFTSFPVNKVVEVPIIVEYWQIFKTDVMPRWYAASTGAKAKVIASTDTEDLSKFSGPLAGNNLGDTWKRTKDDHNILMTTENRFAKNADVSVLSAAELRGQIVPTPMEVTIYPQDADLSKGILLEAKDLDKAATEAVLKHFKALGIMSSASGYPIKASVDAGQFKGPLAVSGAYQLKIGEKGAEITAFDQSGIFYGLQSILSVLPANGSKKIATLEAKDAPRFDYRAIFLDVGRNFHSKEAVLRLLDQMSAYKLNKFHFHLSDDEGWRIEIPGLPELTDVGSKRCHDVDEKICLLPQLGSGPDANNNGSGHFSRADYIEIVKYANARQIEVIPEIDMPAHARAAVVSMEARYDRLHKAGKEKEANEFRLVDPTDTSNCNGQ